MNKKQVHKGWVAAARVNEPGSGEAPASFGALFKPGPWSGEIEEMEQFINNSQLPDSFRIDRCSKVIDIPLFLKTHLSIVKGHNGNDRYTPYMDRLRTLYLKLK